MDVIENSVIETPRELVIGGIFRQIADLISNSANNGISSDVIAYQVIGAGECVEEAVAV